MPQEPEDPQDELFEEPPATGAEQDQIGEQAPEEASWDKPDAEAEEQASQVEDIDLEASEFDDKLLSAHAQVESFLEQQVQAAADETTATAESLIGTGNIVGVGLGTADEATTFDVAPGTPCLQVYVAEPCDQNDARQALADAVGTESFQDGDLPVNVVVTGIIEAQPHRFKIRPAPGGVSCSHLRVTAGTLGGLVIGNRSPRNRRLMILSNNHVIANSNNARFGDAIIQPGRADGGSSPRCRIAILERFVPINFSGRANYVDCASGWAWPKLVRPEQVYLRGGRPNFFRLSRRPRPCHRGMQVGKSGRTTQLTAGRVVDCNATIRVNYGGGRMALFKDQVTIRGLGNRFSAGGDSGSQIFSWDRNRNPVGLLFAGGGGFTFANKIQRVLAALDVRLAN